MSPPYPNASHSELNEMFHKGTVAIDKAAEEHLSKVLAEYGFVGVIKITVEVSAGSADQYHSPETRSWTSTASFKRP